MSFISLACLFTDDLCTLHFASSFSPENFKDQELLQVVVSSCMESEGSSWNSNHDDFNSEEASLVIPNVCLHNAGLFPMDDNIRELLLISI
jgi:hypothetical protein